MSAVSRWGMFVALATMGIGAIGCGHTETHAAMLREPQARTSGVELYLSDQPQPERPYSEIAFVQAVGFGTEATPEDVAKALTTRASMLGCDAVVRAFLDVGYSRAHAAGVCVKYVGEGPAVAQSKLPTARDGNPPPPAIRSSPTPKLEPLPSAPHQGR
ncbi:hypothetical protein [Labilithrix luteola]|nr:hypothetical protein [Labilithrix luteola]